ncbi:MAG: serine/threonine protein kinase [Ktedonobacteraceae bacterium]
MQLEGRQFAQYRLVRLLRRGGMGEVYLAEDRKLNRQVAMKVIRTDNINYDDEEEAREAARLFLREAQVVAKLDHPHILPLYDADEEHVGSISLLYMVMPLREEHSFADWLQEYHYDRVLSPRIVERIVRQAASALQYAHENGIVHQDIKASNFLIRDATQSPGQLYLQLADFGVAKLMTTTSQSQIIRGTPTHMAPEQWENRAVPATDQYALAVMAYELLTGQPPFEDGNHQRMWYQHAYIQPLSPSTLNSTLPTELDAVLLRALAKTPQERYRSISAFALAFRQALLDAEHARKQPDIQEDETQVSAHRPLPLTVIAREPNYGEPPTTGAKGRSKAKFVLLIGLAFALVAVSAATFIFFFGHPGNTGKSGTIFVHGTTQTTETTPNLTASAQVNASATAQASASASAQSGIATATAQANATSTPIAERNATATARTATAIAQATATITAYNNMPGTVSFIDPLQDDSKGLNWDINYIPGMGGCQFTGDAYQNSIPQAGSFSACYAESTDYSNFFYEMQVSITQGDQGGVLFRRDSTSGSFYYFHIDSSGKFALDLYQNDILVKTLAGGSNTIIDTTLGHTNLLAVQANGSAIVLFVNKHSIGSVINGILIHGQIGVMANAVTDPTVVMFSNARVLTL